MEWAHDAADAVRARLGLDGSVPDEATLRRILEAVDDAVFMSAIATWPGNRAQRRRGQRLIAVDGRTTRGARLEDVTTPHLLDALEHTTFVVLRQVHVDGRSNGITAFKPLMAPIDLTDAVVTGDELHTQSGHAEHFHERGVDWIFTVEGNRPKLLAELEACLERSRCRRVDEGQGPRADRAADPKSRHWVPQDHLSARRPRDPVRPPDPTTEG